MPIPIPRCAVALGLVAYTSLCGANVPEHVAERATAIAKSTGGSGTQVVSVSSIDDYPGLTQATLVEYQDAAGRAQSLVMLPDGEHYIPGPVAHYSVKSAVGPKQSPGQPKATPERPPAPTAGAYRPNGYLRPESFSSIAEGVFESMEEAPKVYMSILQDATAVIDGQGDNPVYVMFDPACPYCRDKYQMLRPLIDSGEITVHWVPVIGPSRDTTNLLALADTSASNGERLERLQNMLDGRSYTGALPDRARTENILNRTTALLQMMRSVKSRNQPAGTPQTFFVDSEGLLRHQYGYGQNADEEILNAMRD